MNCQAPAGYRLISINIFHASELTVSILRFGCFTRTFLVSFIGVLNLYGNNIPQTEFGKPADSGLRWPSETRDFLTPKLTI